jgi:hypothetical protein
VASKSPTYRIEVTVLGIVKGSRADFLNVQLSSAQKQQTPYYVTVRVRNLGAGNLAADNGYPAQPFSVIDDRGQQTNSLTVLGTFTRCDSPSVPKAFTRGVAWTLCTIYMLGSGGSIAHVDWTGGGADPYTNNPIVWRAG